MQNYDWNKDCNIAFQEAQFLWERGAEMQILQQSFTAADADTNNVFDSGELMQFSASTGRPESLGVFMQNYDLNEDGNIAFQEVKRLTPTQEYGTVYERENGAVQSTQILQRSFTAADMLRRTTSLTHVSS